MTQKWYQVAPMNKARAGLQLVAMDGLLYAIGGWKDHQFLKDVERYDPILNEWTAVKGLNEPRGKFGSVVTADKLIYVVGGRKGFNPFRDELSSMEAYSPEADEWLLMPNSMSIIRGPARATICSSCV